MKIVIHIVALICFNSLFGQSTFEENFENYDSTKFISTQAQYWKTWSGLSGGKDDAKITAKYAKSGKYSLAILGSSSGKSDIIFTLPEKVVSGLVNIEFYVLSENSLYFNLIGNPDLSNSTLGTAELKDNNLESTQKCHFEKFKWQKINYKIDLNNRKISLSINNEHCASNLFDDVVATEFYAFDFYALKDNTKFYIDEFKLDYVANEKTKLDIGIEDYRLTSSNNAANFPVTLFLRARNFSKDTIDSFTLKLFNNDRLVFDTLLKSQAIYPYSSTYLNLNTKNVLEYNEFKVEIDSVNNTLLDDFPSDNSKSLSPYFIKENAKDKRILHEVGDVSFGENVSAFNKSMKSIVGENYFNQIKINTNSYTEYGKLFADFHSHKINRRDTLVANFIYPFSSQEILKPATIFFNNIKAFKKDNFMYDLYFDIDGDTSNMKLILLSKNPLTNFLQYVHKKAHLGFDLKNLEVIDENTYKLSIGPLEITPFQQEIVICGLNKNGTINNSNWISLQKAIEIGTYSNDVVPQRLIFKVNPISNEKKLMIESFENHNVEIYNQNGQMIFNKKLEIGWSSFDFNGKLGGIYFIKSDKVSKLEKVILL